MFQSILENNHQQQLTPDEYISMLIHAEWEVRESKKLQRRLRAARFRYQASVEEINFQHQRNPEFNYFNPTSYIFPLYFSARVTSKPFSIRSLPAEDIISFPSGANRTEYNLSGKISFNTMVRFSSGAP